MTPRVSVVVPTFKRPDLLDRCLAALLTQDLQPAAYEIIIADDAASESTRRQVEGWAARASGRGHCVRYMAVSHGRGPAAARNSGWRAARGEIIAFTDDDCCPAPEWLHTGLSAFVDGVAGASGKLIVPVSDQPTDYELNASLLANAEFVTANCFYRRDALAEVGGFDERFPMAWREDSDLHFRLLRCNARLVQAHDAVVIHPVRPAPWGISLAQQRASMYNALLYRKHPRLYAERIQSAPPWHYYGIVGALLAALVAGYTGHRTTTRVAASMWGLLTARFCAKRLHGASLAPRHVAEMMVTSMLIPPLSIYWRIRGALKFRVFFL